MSASLVADLEPKCVRDWGTASCPCFACSADLWHSARLLCSFSKADLLPASAWCRAVNRCCNCYIIYMLTISSCLTCLPIKYNLPLHMWH